MMLPYGLSLISEAYNADGQAGSALVMLNSALATLAQSGERWFEAELHRRQGELILQPSVQGLASSVANPQFPTPHSQTEAETYFKKASEIAQWQQAKMLELRATTNLARLRRGQGKKTEAREMLAQVYNCFTEGFDTKDLQEAKALLKELA